jgi:hypothetical protein
LFYAGFSTKEIAVRTYNQAIRLLIATGIFLLDLVLLNGVSSQSIAHSAGKDPASQNQARTGIDISEFTDVDALGFLSPEAVKPWGHLFSDETERILLARGDTVYVAFEKGHDVKPGDLYTVFKSSSELEHPLTGRDLGYVISFLGRIVLKKEVNPRLFKAEIVECYRPMQVGDPVIPFQPVSPCIQLSSPEPKMPIVSEAFKIPVVAAKDLIEVIGQFSVLYMNHGHKHGVHRGNLFQIVSGGAPGQPEEPSLPHQVRRGETDQPEEPSLPHQVRREETDQPKEPSLPHQVRRGAPDQPEDPTPPDQVLGYVLVLEARPGTSIGLVITTKRELFSGIMLKSIDLKRSLKEVLTYYGIEYNDAEVENDPLHVLDRLTQKVGSRTDLPEAFLLLSKMPKCPIK